MNTVVADKSDLLTALRCLRLAEVEQRIADLDAERAALSLLRRSLVARDKCKRRAQPRDTQNGGHHE